MSSYKREYDYYANSNSSGDSGRKYERKRKRKSRWGGDESEKVFIPGMPTIIPSNLSKQQEDIYLLQVQIESYSRRLLTGDLGISENPEERSPSPEPIYNTEGKRLNTREFRTRKKFEDERHALIMKMYSMNPGYKPPADYKAPQTKISEKVLIPQEEYPDINFVGLIIGPRGNTLKGMERDTNAKIIIRGKGSVKEGKLARKDGQPLPGEDEPLHAFVTGPTQESVTKAVAKINEVIRKGIELPENMNDLRRSQLRELALLNGTLRENDGPRCSNCGANTHRSWQCPDKPNVTNNVFCTNCNGAGHIAKDCKERPATENVNTAKIDEEYLSLMAELGEAPPASSSSATSAPKATSNHLAVEANSSHATTSDNGWNNGNSNSGTDATASASNGSAAWPGYVAGAAYDPYSAAYANMWDPTAWAAASAAAVQSSGDSATAGAAVDYSGYDPATWAQWSQWYAANAAAAAASGAAASGSQMYAAAAAAPPPPPPPPPQS